MSTTTHNTNPLLLRQATIKTHLAEARLLLRSTPVDMTRVEYLLDVAAGLLALPGQSKGL